MENLYQEIEKDSERAGELKLKTKENLIKHKEQAFLSKFLAQIQINTPIDFNLEKCSWENYKKDKAIKVLTRFEFYSLINRLP